MPDPTFPPYPFITRNMLAFEHGAAFSIQITSMSSASMTMAIRVLTREGVSTFLHVPATNRSIQTETFRITDMPIMVTVTDFNNESILGKSYATISLMYQGDLLNQLAAGWIYGQMALTWPSNNIVHTRPLGGRLTTFSSAVPAAGAEISFTVPLSVVWVLRSASLSLVTDANAGNRRVHLVHTIESTVVNDFFGNIDQAASLTRKYSFHPAGAGLTEADGTDIIVPIPHGILIEAGDTLTTKTANIKATDAFGALNIAVEEYLTP